MSTELFPKTRKRRLRKAPWIRDITQEHKLLTHDLIWPVFIQDSSEEQTAIATMPGVYRYNLEGLLKAAEEAYHLGIQAIALFPAIDTALKDERGQEALNPNNLVCRAIKALKQHCPNLGIIADVALDPFTSHGHDGIVTNNAVVNDPTIAILAEMSLVLAEAGADVLAPSDMMDGRIGAIRNKLEQAGLTDTLILSYAAKYASSFYGPFRDAVGSAKNLGGSGKETYQMNPANGAEALAEAALDLQEGADMLMVKPGMPYLDIIWRIKERFETPTFAYQVSGEYAMLHHYATSTNQSLEKVFTESLLGFKRAGADGIFTYAAPLIAKALNT